MANGDRTRRIQDDEQPGLFDHIVAADLEGIDPPSIDGVPEVQVHEPAAPAPGQTLAAWGDEDPSLTAPRSVNSIDAWESIEPKEVPVVSDPDTASAEATIEAAGESTAEAVTGDDVDGPEAIVAEVVWTAAAEAPVEAPTQAIPEPVSRTDDPVIDDAPIVGLAEQLPAPTVGDVVDLVDPPSTDVPAQVHDEGMAVVEVVTASDIEPEPVTPTATESGVATSEEPSTRADEVPAPEAVHEAPVFRRVEPSDVSGREPVIALHGMPSRRAEPTVVEQATASIAPRGVASEPTAMSRPLPTHGIWAWLELTRISNVLTVATNAVVGLWVAHLLAGQATMERFVDWMPRHVGVIAGICLLYLFGMVLNDLLDREVDAQERPTRPLPSGRVGVRPAILLAVTLMSTGVWMVGGGSFPIPGLAAIAVGLAFGSFAKGKRNAIQWIGEAWAVVGAGAILWNWLDHWRHAELRTPWGFEAVLLLVGCIAAYSILHRSWRGSVVLMGLCRALAYWCATLSVLTVSGMSMSNMTYNGSAVGAWGLVLFPGLVALVSTIAVSLMARDEARLPDASTPEPAAQPARTWVRVLLVAAVLLPWAFSPVVTGGARGMLQVMTIVALPMALLCGGIFIVKCLHAERAMRSHPTRIAGGVSAWLAAFCLLDASTLSVLGAPGLSVVALGCWWITRSAQRRVAGS